MAGSEAETARSEGRGMLYGLVGVLLFSVTLPATRVAVAYLDPVFVGTARALVAGACAAVLLLVTRQRLPTAGEVRALLVVIGGVVIGFPVLSAWAMRYTDASHGAVVNGLLPLFTAVAGVLRAGDRPSWRFWAAALLGSAVVVGFALRQANGALLPADLAMLGAVATGAFGYAEGGRLARTMGSWQVICWALVIAAPLMAIPAGYIAFTQDLSAPPEAWLGFAYVSVISMWLGFFAWYRGLALGGVARVSQIQLLQPFFTMLAATLLIGEELSPPALGVALVVALIVALGRRAAVQRAGAPLTAAR